MIKEGKFGTQEAICLVTITISVKVFFTSPALLGRLVGTAIWYTTLISNVTAIAAFTVIYLLLKRFPGKNLVEIFNMSLGRVFGFIFSSAFVILFLYEAGAFLREFSEVLRNYVFPETPTGLIAGALVLTAGAAAFLGLESIARISRLFGYILLFGFILVIILASKNFNYRYLFPILGYGLDKTVIHGLNRSSVYGEVVVLAIFAGSLHEIRDIRRIGYTSLVLSGLIISTGLLSFILVFPYFAQQEISAPMYAVSRLIKYGDFFTGLDIVFLLLWNTSSSIAISVLLYSSVSTYCKLFRLQDARPVIVPMAVILFAVAMTPRDFSGIVYSITQQLREYGWIIFYGLPLLTFIAAVLRKKEGKQGKCVE